VIERALIMSAGSFIDAEHLSLRAKKHVPLSSATDLETLQKNAVERAMRDTDGNKVRAAKQLGISRMQLYTRLRKFGLDNAPSLPANEA
jgi:DNA-binding NtrC family response regulator